MERGPLRPEGAPLRRSRFGVRIPRQAFWQTGYGIDIATLCGGPGKFEWWADPKGDEAIKAAWEATKDDFKAPTKLSEVVAEGLEDYAAIFVPRGHGAMKGVPVSTDVRDALDFCLDNDRLEITNSEMTGATTRDRNLLTGDSPLAAHQLGKDSALALLEKFTS